MDYDLIYAKTASGEEAMQQRTRVMQRNVRMVLILVDGQSSVADLCLKTGNPKLTENALRELEEGGFIGPVIDQDSLWVEGNKVAQEIRASAVEKSAQSSSPGMKSMSRVSQPSLHEFNVLVHSGFNPPPLPDDGSPLSQFSLPPMLAERVCGKSSPEEIPQKKKFKGPKKSKSDDASGSSFVDGFMAFLPKSDRKDDGDVSIKPIQRGQRKSVGWPLRVLIVISFSFLLILLTLGFFPYGRYLPEVEAAFAQACGRPVKVGAMRVEVYPKPGVYLGGVRVGSDKDELSVAEIRLLPAIGSVFASKLSFREVVLSGVSLPAEWITGLPEVFMAMAKPTARVGVEHVRLEKTEVSFSGLGFSGMAGDARLSAGGLFQSLSLYSSDRSLSLEAKSSAQGVDVVVEGLAWRISPESPFLFDSVNLRGNVGSGVFTISNMELRLFDGLIKGEAVLRADRKPALSGNISFERVNSSRFFGALGIGSQLSGETAGKIHFSSTSDSWGSVLSAIDAVGEFSIHRGSIRGIDLAEAVRRASNTPVQGGITQFELFSGKVRVRPTGHQFTGLVLNSGLMQSTGFFEVDRYSKVNGRMEVQMRGSVNQMRVPVSISGPLKTPMLQVGRN